MKRTAFSDNVLCIYIYIYTDVSEMHTLKMDAANMAGRLQHTTSQKAVLFEQDTCLINSNKHFTNYIQCHDNA
jgi:hypothetical protein